MGIVTSAAEIFETLHLWDEVVECYMHAGKKGKAEEIVRERLKENETPRMWAALGDLTSEKSHYEKAWELSDGKYARAKAAMGRMAFDAGNFQECYECMLTATKVRRRKKKKGGGVGLVSYGVARGAQIPKVIIFLLQTASLISAEKKKNFLVCPKRTLTGP